MANKINLNLSGGMNAKTSPLIIKDNECELALNYTLNKLGGLEKRAGYSQYSNQPQVGKRVLGLYEFRAGTTYKAPVGTKVQLMAIENTDANAKKIYSTTSGANWTERATYALYGQKSRWASFLGNVIHLDGTATTAVKSSNGTSWATGAPAPTGTTTGAVMAEVKVFQDRVYAMGSASTVTGGIFTNSNFGSKVFFSSLPDVNATTITYAEADNFDVNPDDNDAIVGCENNGNRLLIFKHDSMYRWTYGQVEADRLIGVGTSAIESVRTNFDVGITFFANAKGVFAYTGSRPKLISRKIQPYIDAVTDWTDVCAEVDDDHYYLSVGDITVNGRTFTNAVLVYHISLDAWTIFTLADRPVVFARMYGSSTTKMSIYFGSSTGKVFKFLDSSTDDAGTAIQCDFISKEHMLSYPERTNVTWIDIFSQNPSAASVSYDLDRNADLIATNYMTVGIASTRITNFKTPMRECNSIRIRITDNSKFASSVEGYNIEHEPKAKRDETTVKIRRKGDV